jgi:xanthine dehydrogenase FAD-binding subunit
MSEILAPSGLDEYFELRQRHPDAQALAGGTDLLVRRRARPCDAAAPLVALNGIDALHGLSEDEDGLSIGALTSFSALISDARIKARAPLLACAARTVGGPAIRNMATIGGNVCTASPAGDSLTPLYLAAALIEMASPHGRRTLPIADFIQGPGRTALRPGELLTRIVLPPSVSFAHQRFEKVGRRRSLAISVASFCGELRFAADGTVAEARFAWGSVAPTVLRIPALEADLVGRRLDRLAIRSAASVVRERVAPISDIRASADYRRRVAGNLLTRFLEDGAASGERDG